MENKFLPLLFTTIITVTSASAFGLGDATDALSSMNNDTTKTANVSHNSMPKTNTLIDTLTNKLGVSQKQASGGVGSILSYAKSALPSNKYATVANAVPNASSLLEMAPKVSSAMSGLGAMGTTSSSLGGMAALTSQFSSLGLNSGMITKFVPVILNYFKKSGSTNAMSILSGLFSK